MEMKNFFKTAIFAVTLALGCAAAINFAPKAEAAYVTRTVTSNGNSDYGFYMGKACNIKEYYENYVSPKNYTPVYIYGDKYYKNEFFGNYAVTKNSPMNIKVFGDDPITAFVEKEYLRTEGDFVLFGNEYGYYVHTTPNKYNNTLYYISDIILIDYDYSQPINVTSGETDNYLEFYFSARIVCQYQVLTINRSRLKELAWANPSQMPLDITVDNEDFSDEMYMHYEFDKCTWPSDGYVSVPVLKKDWRTNPTTGVASMDHLYLSNFTTLSKLQTKDASGVYVNAPLADFSVTGDGRGLKFKTYSLDLVANNEDLQKEIQETLKSQIDSDLNDLVSDAFSDWNPIAGIAVDVITNAIEYGKILYSYFNPVVKQDTLEVNDDIMLLDPNIRDTSLFGFDLDSYINRSNDLSQSITSHNKLFEISRRGFYESDSGNEYKEDYLTFGYIFDQKRFEGYNNEVYHNLRLSWVPYYKSGDIISTPDNITYVSIDRRNEVSELDNVMIFTNDDSNLQYDYYGYDSLKSLDDLKQYAGGTNYKFIDVSANRAKAFEFNVNKTGTYNFTLSANNIMTIKVWEKDGELVYYGNWNNYPSFSLCLAPETYIMEIIVWESSDKSQNSKYVKIYSINKTISISNNRC